MSQAQVIVAALMFAVPILFVGALAFAGPPWLRCGIRGHQRWKMVDFVDVVHATRGSVRAEDAHENCWKCWRCGTLVAGREAE
jgi:hypothetical protein